MKIQINDTKFFISIISTFSHQRTVTFSLKDKFTILSTNQIFLLEEKCYEIIEQGDDFTVCVASLLKNISLLYSYPLILDVSDRLYLCTNTKYFSIGLNINCIKYDNPCINYINSELKFIISNVNLLKDFSGDTIYEIGNGKLTLKNVSNVQTDTIIIDLLNDNKFNHQISYYEDEFTCSNYWVNNLKGISSLINGIMICVSEFVVSIQVLFKKHEGSYLELQTYKKVTI